MTSGGLSVHGAIVLLALLVALPLGAAGAGIISSPVGSGAEGYSGDGGPADQARLNGPFHCCKDRAGNLYVADTFNHCIRKITPKGVISTVAGDGKAGFADGKPGRLNEPYGVLADRDGNLFIVDRLNAAIRRVDAKTGLMTTYAGTGEKTFGGDGGPRQQATFVEPNAFDFDREGNLYIADVGDCRIRRIDAKTGIVTTVAGTGKRAHTGDGGPATRADLKGARGVAFDRVNNMYICEREGNSIRKVDAKTQLITTIAGTGAKGYTGDGGPAVQATFNGPKWVHVGPDGNVYVVDTENQCVRRINPRTGKIKTVAGGRPGPEGDGGPANKAGMGRPHGCWLDGKGRLYVADTLNHRVRMVELGKRKRGKGKRR